MINLNEKIAIIGAGPGGLGAAEALKEKGYKNITIFEKTNKPGGQAISFSYKTPNGKEIYYDLGSFGYVGSSRINKLIKKHHIEISDHLGLAIFNLKTNQYIFDLDNTKKFSSLIKILPFILLDLSKFFLSMFKYKELLTPGYRNLAHKKELAICMEEWINQQNYKYLSPAFLLSYQIVSNFGYPERSGTAAEILKCIFQYIKSFKGYLFGKFLTYKRGYQELWNQVSLSHHIIYKSNIQNISRANNKVTIKYSNDKQEEFDKIIIACPVTAIQSTLDCTEKENFFFNKVTYSPGWRGAFTAQNLTDHNIVLFEDNIKDKVHSLLLYYPTGQVDANTYLYSVTFSNSLDDPVDKLKQEANEILTDKFNAKDIKWLHIIKHKFYGPRFSSQDFAEGIYDQFEKIQGKNNTFYTGALLSGNLHPLVLDYSYNLAKRFF